MEMKELVTKTRSFRRFQQEPIAEATLRELVELARLSPSGSNLQPLKFILSSTLEKNARIFPYTAWAGYLADWDGPAEGERPSGYIVILLDKGISQSAGCDHGIAAQSIVLGAMEKGIGACMIGSLKRKELAAALAIPEQYEILLAIALGRPLEKVVLEEAAPGGDVKYYRDENSVHHVPKRPLAELILKL
ncbi:MAG: nitroreductase family protein [Planctomycetes bacterium]|nr:nitroreductase family protein [Planctomycetota bacterium]